MKFEINGAWVLALENRKAIVALPSQAELDQWWQLLQRERNAQDMPTLRRVSPGTKRARAKKRSVSTGKPSLVTPKTKLPLATSRKPVSPPTAVPMAADVRKSVTSPRRVPTTAFCELVLAAFNDAHSNHTGPRVTLNDVKIYLRLMPQEFQDCCISHMKTASLPQPIEARILWLHDFYRSNGPKQPSLATVFRNSAVVHQKATKPVKKKKGKGTYGHQPFGGKKPR